MKLYKQEETICKPNWKEMKMKNYDEEISFYRGVFGSIGCRVARRVT